MSEFTFFPVKGPYTLEEICEGLNIDCSSNMTIRGVAPLSSASSSDISFLDNSKYLNDLKTTKAAAVLLKEEHSELLPDGVYGIEVENPHLCFAKVAQKFHPLPNVIDKIDERAIIHETASIGSHCQIDAGAWIGEGVSIGNRCHIGPNAVINAGVSIGDDSRIGNNASLEYCHVGSNANIHSGVRIGTRGFGFAIDPAGFVDVPQTGRVIIGHFVEIGANSTVDRGMGPDTVIGDGCKIDNLIHIGHNVKLGKGCVLAAMSGIAGSTELGDFVVCGAQSGISGHLKIGSQSTIAAKAGVTKDLPPKSIVAGFPAEPINTWRKRHAITTRIMKKKG